MGGGDNGYGSEFLGVTSNNISQTEQHLPSGSCCSVWRMVTNPGNETCICSHFPPSLLPLFSFPPHPPPSQCPAPHRTHTRGRRMISELPHPPTSGSWSEEQESVMSYLLLTIINLSNVWTNWAICTFPNRAIYAHSQVHKFMVSLFGITVDLSH